jgi:Ca2+-binding RTX toxin-like protein
VNGGQGDDVLYGNSGKDILVGGSGQDLLFGGADADVFVLSQPEGVAQIDVLMDFDAAQGDKIHLPRGITGEGLTLTSVDTNGDGVTDATLVQASFSGQFQALVQLRVVQQR